jgi:hypothetical protein
VGVAGGGGERKKKAWFCSSLIKLIIFVSKLPKKLNQSSSLETWGYQDFLKKNSQKIQKPIHHLLSEFLTPNWVS